jgi:hypothetical protein
MVKRKTQLTTITVLLAIGLVIAPAGLAGPATETASAQSGFVVTDEATVNADGTLSDPLEVPADQRDRPAGAVFTDPDNEATVTVDGSTPNIELDINIQTNGDFIRFEVNGEIATIERVNDREINDTRVADDGRVDLTNTIELDVSDAVFEGEPTPELSSLDIADQGGSPSVVAGTEDDISVNIENTGDSESNTYDVNLTIANDTTDVVTRTVTTEQLDAGEDQAVTFSDPISGLEPDDYTVTVADSQGFSTVSGTLTVQEQTGSVTFNDQATNATTITSPGRTNASVTLEDVSASINSSVIVTYENESGDTVIAAGETFSADELDGIDATFAVADPGGFPGNHTAHVIPETNLSDPSAGDTVSSETVSAAIDSSTATVFQGTVDFADQAVVGSAGDGDLTVNATLDDGDGAESTTPYVINLHETDANGTPTDFIGTTDIIEGAVTDEPLDIERADGTNTTINATGEFVAMIHLVNDSKTVGDESTPGEYPILPNSDTDGFVSGGVNDNATISVVTFEFSKQATASSTITSDNATAPAVTVENVDVQEDVAVVVTYDQGGETIIAGLETRTASELDGSEVVVPVANTSGFPGDHTAHLIPQSELSDPTYAPGDVVSTATVDAAFTSETATVSQGTVTFAAADNEYVTNTSDVEVAAANLDPSEDYTIKIHETDASGAVGAIVGTSDVLTDNETTVTIPVEEINDTNEGEYVAMLHYNDTGNAIRNTDATTTGGFVAGNVADNATVDILTPAASNLSALDIAGEGADASIVEGDDADVSVTVTNDGDATGDFDVDLEIGNGTVTENRSISLNGSEVGTVTFENVTGDLTPGNYNVTVNTTDDTLQRHGEYDGRYRRGHPHRSGSPVLQCHSQRLGVDDGDRRRRAALDRRERHEHRRG